MQYLAICAFGAISAFVVVNSLPLDQTQAAFHIIALALVH